MKRLVWYYKIIFLLVVMFVTIGNYTNSMVSAQDDREDFSKEMACNTNKWCGWTSGGGCRCTNGGSECTGCFVRDGDTGCGKCRYGQ